MGDFVTGIEEMKRYREMVDELCDVESGLSSWECDFLDSLNEWDGCFTIYQASALQKIYDRMF